MREPSFYRYPGGLMTSADVARSAKALSEKIEGEKQQFRQEQKQHIPMSISREELDAKLDASGARMEAAIARMEGRLDTAVSRFEGKLEGVASRIEAKLDAGQRERDQVFDQLGSMRWNIFAAAVAIILAIGAAGVAVIYGNTSLVQAITATYDLGIKRGETNREGSQPAATPKPPPTMSPAPPGK